MLIKKAQWTIKKIQNKVKTKQVEESASLHSVCFIFFQIHNDDFRFVGTLDSAKTSVERREGVREREPLFGLE
jgi:hypothetical protein